MERIYLHIGNGGVNFIAGRDSEGYLALQVEATHFGNVTNSMKVYTNAESMQKIGEMLIEASKEPHQVYVCAAEWDKPKEKLTMDGSVSTIHLAD